MNKVITANKNFDGNIFFYIVESDIVENKTGKLFIAECDQYLCQLSFISGKSCLPQLDRLKKNFPNATLTDRRPAGALLKNKTTFQKLQQSDFTFYLNGTDFQLAVWRELLKIPTGSTCHYRDIARRIGKPRSHRAIGTAVGANPIAILIPCHRVLPASGGIGHYFWGAAIKQTLLNREGVNSFS